MKVRVRFLRNVMGYRAGETDWVEATPLVELLVQRGHVRWLDQPAYVDWVEETGDPAELVTLQNDDPADSWVSAEPGEDEIVLPSGEVIAIDELMDRLAFEDDGGAPFDQDD
jgi:hypothetical protein